MEYDSANQHTITYKNTNSLSYASIPITFFFVLFLFLNTITKIEIDIGHLERTVVEKVNNSQKYEE